MYEGKQETKVREDREEICLRRKEWSTMSRDTEKSSRIKSDVCP